MSKPIEPKKGSRPGDLEFRFPRTSLMLAVDFDHRGGGGRPWITAYLWDRRKGAKPGQLCWATRPLADCYLRAASTDLEPSLCFGSNSFALRPAEYEALRAFLVPEGLVLHVPSDVAVERPTQPLEVARGDGRVVSVTVPGSDRTYGGEVEGGATRTAFYVHREVGGMLGGFLTPQRTWTTDQKFAWKTYDRVEAGRSRPAAQRKGPSGQGICEVSRSAGTGSPSWFKCPVARRTVGRGPFVHTARMNIQLTGQRRERYVRGHVVGVRSDIRFIYQFKCLDCGHVGWSRHIDIARRFKSEFPEHATEK